MKKNYSLLLLIVVLASEIFNTSIQARGIRLEDQFPRKPSFDYADTSYRIISAPDNSYGYEVLIDRKVLIHQPSVPGRAGRMGFKRKVDAEKVAQLVIRKLSQGIMPPTINENELLKLKIISN